MKMLKFLPALCAGTALFGAVAPEATFVRLSAMPQPPVIDGKIAYNEWRYASTSFGGVSNKSGLLTRRENDFRFGYDAKNLYFSITSEMPVPPQMMNGNDKVEFQIIPPNGKKTVIIIDHEGKGTIPGGVVFKSGFAPSLLNRFRNNCWTVEMEVPLSALGVSAIENGKAWKLQMMRHWSSDEETGFWHYTPKGKGNEYGIFVPDSSAPVVSFDGFGHHGYEATGNYQWTYRIENPGKAPLSVYNESYMLGISGEPTLDINNPDLLGKSSKHRIENSTRNGYVTVAEPGKSAFFQLYLMAQFPGQPRLLFSQIRDKQNKDQLYYQRSFFWDVTKSLVTASYKEKLGLPYLNSAYYPSYGNKLRVAASFNRKLPILFAKIEVKDASGKVLWKTSRSGFGNKLEDFEAETVLKDLPLGDYQVVLTSTDGSGRKYVHTRTFCNRKFAWQNQNIGKERVIIPPFKPLQLNKENQTIKALLTGYKQGQGLWSEIYAEGENILAAPVAFFFDGRPVVPGKAKLVSEEKDRIVYESTAQVGKVKFTFVMDYDYDGFCKVTVKAVPQGKVAVRDFGFRVPLKNEIVQYYDSIHKTGARGGNAPDLTIPAGEGALKLPGIQTHPGRVHHYLWLGGVYKGFCWMIDSNRYCSFEPKKLAWDLVRSGKTLTFRQFLVNKPAEWTEPMEWVVGFEPTPVKPRNEKYLAISEWMYDYPPAKGADLADMNSDGAMCSWLDYPVDAIAHLDDSWYKYLFSTRNRVPSEEERVNAAKNFLARNKEVLDRDFPLVDQAQLFYALRNKRQFGKKYFLHYQLPTLYSYKWPEAEMYKAEWLPWDYPIDDASNEYVTNQTSEHTDFMLYFMRDQVRRGYDGMNFDTFPLGGGFNQITGNGVRTRSAKIPYITNAIMLRTASDGITSGMMLFGWREMVKRTATMLYVEGKLPYGTPWAEVHSTDGHVIPVMGFCSTILPWERSGGGDEYQRRYPASFIIADTLGTQSGSVPRVIVKTHSTRLPEAEQVKSLIAVSFGYGLMNLVDQGVTRGFDDFRTSRDEVFTFGYGRPENKTLFFYSREKQPVTCDAKNILTTQVIRPDGKTLLMIGNMGDAVKAKFDISALNYGECRISDKFSGLLLAKPEIDVEKNGYALLLIEKGKAPTAEEIAKHNKRILGETFSFDKPEQFVHETTGKQPICKDGIYTIDGVVHLFGTKPIEIEAGRTYTLTGEFRKDTDTVLPSMVVAAIFLDDKGNRIPTGQYMSIPASLTTLAADAKAGATEAVVKAVPGFKFDSGCSAVLALGAKADESDLPNARLTPGIAKLQKGDGVIRITFKKPLAEAIPAGTPVRLHYSYHFYRPVPEMFWYNRAAREWKKFGGKITIPQKGLKRFVPALIYYDHAKPSKGHIEIRNFQLLIK